MYEHSLVAMSKGLTTEERLLLGEAISIIQGNTQDIPQLSEEANNRSKLGGMTREQIISKAKSIVLDWFERNKEAVDKSDQASEFRKYTKIRIWTYHQMVPAPEYEISLIIENHWKSDITVDSIKIDNELFVTNDLFLTIPRGKNKIIKGYVFLDQPPTSITQAYVNMIKVIPVEFEIPVGFNEYLDHIGYRRNR